MNKKDIDKMFKKYQPVVKKTGKQLSKAIKTAEEDVSKMYRIAQAHMEIQLKSLQKEKLYHELGKYVAKQLEKESLNLDSLDKYKKRLDKLTSEGDKVKKKLSRVNTVRKKKKIAKKK